MCVVHAFSMPVVRLEVESGHHYYGRSNGSVAGDVLTLKLLKHTMALFLENTHIMKEVFDGSTDRILA
jgi:hypothetical protein